MYILSTYIYYLHLLSSNEFLDHKPENILQGYFSVLLMDFNKCFNYTTKILPALLIASQIYFAPKYVNS